MKKTLPLTLSVVLAAGTLLAACSSKEAASTPAPSSATTPTPAAATATPAPAAPVRPEIKSDGLIPAWDNSKNPQQAKNRKDSAIIGMTAPDGIFNPFYSETAYDNYVVNLIFDSMLTVNKDATYSPALAAEMPKISDDKLVYTFKLKPDLKFSNGDPITADDFAFALTILHDKSYDGPSDISLNHIKGGDAYREGTATSVEGIKVIDPLTVEITTTEIGATTMSDLGGYPIAPKSVYGKDYKQGNLDYMKDLNHTPIGSGPYTLAKYTPGQEVVFAPNATHYGGAPKTPNIIYKVTTDETQMQMLQTGETDMNMISVSMDNVNALIDQGFMDVNIFPTNGYGYIAFNHKKAKFQDKKVRQALAYGLDRKQIVEAVYGPFADVINIPQSKLSWAYTEDGIEKYEFNLDKAKQLLDEAGWVVGKDGIREKNGEKFEINFVATSPNVVNDAIIPVATANYKELGIKFVPEQMDFTAVGQKRKEGKFDMLFMAWGLTPDPDPTNIFSSKGSQNEIGYSNPKADELMKAALKEVEIDKRKPVYKELYQVLNDDLPYIFMYQRRDMWPVNSRLQGFDMSPYKNFTYSLAQVQVQ
ncbi:ABC transporter substrate-binding protein [Paenibacillus albiflavus]|uniref:ABC transporter substrate-binding protein n=1 Tax=Paenibacillus albiflavus TaxID=2545760 RepID=A0A4R4ECY1_9BACL|nr:ABC transporter substrate-binding protein [Paenibacillus albiflavus]TCZ77816.1 ABC transporter substrate-binding protein [Paenibacillus albiflavus]